MKFANTYIIYFLWLIPLLILFFIYAYKRRNKLMEEFCNNSVCKKIVEGISSTRRVIKYVLITLIFIFMIIALAGPQWGYTWEDIHRRGVDIYVALDVSDSMLAEDINPNRLERAKN